MCCVDRKFRSVTVQHILEYSTPTCDHVGEDKITLICLLEILDVCESQRRKVLVVGKDQGSEIVLKMK